MKKYDKLWYIDRYPEMNHQDDLEVTIKYDGSNGRLGCENGKIVFGTRNWYPYEIQNKKIKIASVISGQNSDCLSTTVDKLRGSYQLAIPTTII